MVLDDQIFGFFIVADHCLEDKREIATAAGVEEDAQGPRGDRWSKGWGHEGDEVLCVRSMPSYPSFSSISPYLLQDLLS